MMIKLAVSNPPLAVAIKCVINVPTCNKSTDIIYVSFSFIILVSFEYFYMV